MPARTLSWADAGLSCDEARFCCTQSQVPGITCMTPRALADDTAALLKPLSCQAIADASDPGTPFWPAIWLISADDVCVAVGCGPPCGIAVGSGCGCDACGARRRAA